MELLSFGNPALVQPEVQAVSERLNRALKVARMVAREWDLKTGRILYSANAPEVPGVSSDQAEMSWAAVHPDAAITLCGIVKRAIAGEWKYLGIGLAIVRRGAAGVESELGWAAVSGWT